MTVLVNPDGHEWKRGKWNVLIKRYWKLSERLMVKHADLLVCDSRGIEQYIHEDYAQYRPRTTFIAYGADLATSTLDDQSPELLGWMKEHRVTPGAYYLIIGRFVPENNYELMIKEFMKSDTDKDLVIITGIEQNPLYDELQRECRFDRDPRIKFVGTVYEQQLLKKIRELAYGYCHGHEVGGTNPSLLEALASTKLNLLYDVVFNREVGEDGALYFSAEPGSMAAKISELERYDDRMIKELEAKAKGRISAEYTWNHIVKSYEHLFHSFEVLHRKPSRVKNVSEYTEEKQRQSR